MTVAIDSNVLVDILGRDPVHYETSRNAVSSAAAEHQLIVGEVVFSELSSRFDDPSLLIDTLKLLRIEVRRSSLRCLYEAGIAFRSYTRQRQGFSCPTCGQRVTADCPACGSSVTRRQHILPDFMIGAHALVHAGRLLTRDRGYYRTYFPNLTLV